MNTSLKTFFIFFILTGVLANAQDKIKDTINHPRLTKFPLFTTDYIHYPNTQISNNIEVLSVNVKEWQSSIFIPIELKNKKTTLLNKLDYGLLKYKSISLLENFHSIKYRFIVLHKLQKNWSVALGGAPTVASDFNEALSYKDFYYEVNGVVFKRINPKLKLGLGTTYTTIFGNAVFIPIINLVYKSHKWTTNLYIPQYFRQTYQINKKSSIGLNARLLINLYNTAFSKDSRNTNLDRVLYSRINIGPQYQHKIYKDLYLNITAGITLRNLLEVQNNEFHPQMIYSVKNGGYIQAGLRILK